MRGESTNTLRTSAVEKGPPDIIRKTRELVLGLTEKQRFQIAKRHLNDALSYKTPRLDTYSNNLTKRFKVCYNIQTSLLWTRFLMILSYVFMYSIIFLANKKVQQGIGFASLIIFWADVGMEIYHKRFEVLRISSRFQGRFYFRISILILLLVDQLVGALAKQGTVRPFMILRGILPIFYDTITRKSFQALLASYKDIAVYIAFYSIVIVIFAIIANQFIEIPPGTEYDRFRDNYQSLGKCIFVIYVLSSYDSYPDNQMVAIQQSQWIYAFFILFIFLNVFFFVTIPATVLFNSFRETRSKTILIDEIKQQHSLIMAFVSLGEENLNISQQKLIAFLLYVYKNKIRYLDYITEVCLKLDDNNNGKVQVNQFMQLCKVLQSNSSMMPPQFHDWQWWLNFRNWVNKYLHLKTIINSVPFKIITAIFILLTFVNCCCALYVDNSVFHKIDDVFMGFYCFEIALKFIGMGPQNFFNSSWNKLDFVLITVGLVLELTPSHLTPHNSDILFKMARIFRVSLLVSLATQDTTIRSQVYMKYKKLISQMASIIPIVLKFFPIYCICYYQLGVLGMQIFNKDNTDVNASSYSRYDNYSNFRSFLGSQYIFVMVLVEAGWSEVAFSHSYQYGYHALTMLFFVFSHVIIVIVLSSLLKGLAWEVYDTVHQEFDDRKNSVLKAQMRQLNIQRKKQQFQSIMKKNQNNQLLLPDTLITRQLYENRIDIEIFKKLKELTAKPNILGRGTVNRSGMVSHFIEDRNIMIDEIEMRSNSEDSLATQHQARIGKIKQSLNLPDIEDVQQEDIEDEMQKFLSKLLLHHKIRYSEAIAYPKAFTQFLQRKMQPAHANIMKHGFNIDKDVIAHPSSIEFLTYQLNVLLEIENSEREQKAAIIKNMLSKNMITEEVSVKLLTKKVTEKNTGIDSNWIMRKLFLSDTNEDLIKKFQIQYFSGVYGKSFKQINKVTIEPLLRLESRLTYCLRNALRYFQIHDTDFFTILSTIQDTISNRLLKKGSLFKFVYQLDSISQTWFSIELKQSNQLRIHFIKTGIWVYTKSMQHNQIRVGEDIFNWSMNDRNDKSHCEKYIKLFFQSFESLAFSLLNHEKFFASDPSRQIYDLFTFYRDAVNVRRLSNPRLRISKIMLVILSRQEERENPVFEYQLSDIKIQEQRNEQRDDLYFRFDESENETFKKLKRIELMDYEKIVESEGIPFTFIVNLMKEIQEILDAHEQNLVYQVQKVLNKEFEALHQTN